jgi:hypothetical protein
MKKRFGDLLHVRYRETNDVVKAKATPNFRLPNILGAPRRNPHVSFGSRKPPPITLPKLKFME